MKLTFPGEPIAKQAVKTTMRGGWARHYYPPKTSKALKAMRALVHAEHGHAPMTGAVRLQVLFVRARLQSHKKGRQYYPVTRPDLDNCLKLLLDALQPDVLSDDNQVVSIWADKIYGENPRTEVEITEVPLC